MPVPKRRKSKSRRDMRRSQHKLTVTTLNPCARCGSPKLPHRVCIHCGYYRGREVIAMEA
ncbi:MAG: 50S ribosomal protein L32 [bacterium]